MSAAAARRPSVEREHLAEVIPLWRNRNHPARQHRNGHHADCPYQRTSPDHCGICASIRKGKR
jgi:hypothetical protein